MHWRISIVRSPLNYSTRAVQLLSALNILLSTYYPLFFSFYTHIYSILYYPILHYSILSHPILYSLIPFYTILSYPILYYPTHLPSPVHLISSIESTFIKIEDCVENCPQSIVWSAFMKVNEWHMIFFLFIFLDKSYHRGMSVILPDSITSYLYYFLL